MGFNKFWGRGKNLKSFFRSRPFALFSISIILILIIISFQNCSDARLKAPQKPGLSTFNSQGESKSTFPLPLSQVSQTRIVFFVDMSISMAHGLCSPQSYLDGSGDLAADSRDISCNGALPSPGVRVEKGVDPLGYRFKIMKTWIQDVVSNSSDPSSVKFLIVPFNGGSVEAQRIDTLQFNDKDSAMGIIDKLIAEQADSINFYNDLAASASGVSQYVDLSNVYNRSSSKFKMGTSTPSTRLKAMATVIQTEGDALAKNSINAAFDIVLISDGVPHPRGKDIKKGFEAIWKMTTDSTPCFEQCKDVASQLVDGQLATCQQNSDRNSCPTAIKQCEIFTHDGDGKVRFPAFNCFTDKPVDSRNEPNGAVRTTGIQYNAMDFYDKAKEYWGDWNENTPNKIALLVKDIRTILDSYSTITSRLSLVWLNPLNIAPEFQSDKENWLLRINSQKYSNRFTALSTSNTPFSLMNQGAAMESYKMAKLYVLNPYVRTGSDGKIHLDSDGDGVFDEDETGSLSPGNPRSNGRCLDSLTAQGLCPQTLTCDPKLDADGDGLNECEEIVLGTNPRNFDSDGDTFPDGLELVYGFNPLISENISNPSNLVSYTLNSQGYSQTQPNQPRTGVYQIKISNITTGNLLASVGDSAHPNSILSIPHPAGINPVIILVKIENEIHKGDVYWGVIKYMLDGTKNNDISVDLSKLQYIKAMDTGVGP